jgi:hypothetical protein
MDENFDGYLEISVIILNATKKLIGKIIKKYVFQSGF